MKIDRPKEWWLRRARDEEGYYVEAGGSRREIAGWWTNEEGRDVWNSYDGTHCTDFVQPTRADNIAAHGGYWLRDVGNPLTTDGHDLLTFVDVRSVPPIADESPARMRHVEKIERETRKK